MCSSIASAFSPALARLDGEQLALIVPLVERGVLVEPLVALQADQLGAVHGGERLGDLGLADAGLAFEQQRPLEELHQPQRGRDVAVGDVADRGEAVGDAFAVERSSAHPSRSSCAGLTRASIVFEGRWIAAVKPGNDEP